MSAWRKPPTQNRPKNESHSNRRPTEWRRRFVPEAPHRFIAPCGDADRRNIPSFKIIAATCFPDEGRTLQKYVEKSWGKNSGLFYFSRILFPILRTQLGRAGFIKTASLRPRFVNGTAEFFPIKGEKRAAAKRETRFRRDQMIAFPGPMLPAEDFQDVLSFLGLPAGNIFIGNVSREISQAAAAAASAFYFPFVFHFLLCR